MMAGLEQELISTLRETTVDASPWIYCYLPQAVPPGIAAALGSSFGSFPLTACEERMREKSYQFATANLDGEGAPDPPDEDWREFLDAVSGPAYRDAVSELMGVSLRQAKTTLSLWEYQAGNWLAPHLDKPEKLITQIFYLTPEWCEGDGGRLLILRDRSAETPERALAPSLGSSAILLRSERSWHAVEAPRAGSPPRRSLTVTFWKEA
jgi:hypothetical protein